MKRFPPDQVRTLIAPSDSRQFIGPVRTVTVHSPPEPHGVRALVVSFEDGARTFWHRHAGGQVLHVIEGRGRARSRDGEEVELQPGDLVVAEPGEEHWHGAAEGTGMTHLAVSIGDTTWGGPPDGA